MSIAPIRIVPQGEILTGAGEAPEIKTPEFGGFFAARARRFAALAARGRADAAYLGLMERVANAQQRLFDAYPPVMAPMASHLELCRCHSLPTLGKDGDRESLWRDGLSAIIDAVSDVVPDPARDALDDLRTMDAARLEQIADRLLAFDFPEVNPAQAPFIAAALQVYWTKRVEACGGGALKKLDVPGLCPACGSPPVASVLRIDIPVPGSRYLSCALCGTGWHLVRGCCSQCGAQEKLNYFHVEGGEDVVRAEACEECHCYVKIMNCEKDPLADPVADDLATLALDVMMDQAGYERASPNLLFVPGQG